MKAWNKLKESLSGLIVSINRYPLTTLFLVLITIINAIAIEGSDDYSKWAVTFLVGAFLSLAAQAVCERLMVKSSIRIASMVL